MKAVTLLERIAAVQEHERKYKGKCPRADGEPCRELEDLKREVDAALEKLGVGNG